MSIAGIKFMEVQEEAVTVKFCFWFKK